ncbi:hypothetical protein [Candidatus Palauibacter sp.]|uniref:hypothetical protein n=1 Tax=Candidatus Palauibacter sp. TaxID=3101350 RepID=UPI003AF315AC
MTEVTLGWEDEEFVALAGDTELFRVQPSATFMPVLADVTGVALGLSSSAPGRTGIFDWVEVTGTESSADMSAGLGATRKIESLRVAKDGADIPTMALDELPRKRR